MFRGRQRQQGFTLIEIIASLVLLGVLGVVAGLGILQITKGFIFGKDNAKNSASAGLAMHRLIKEFTSITSVTSGTATSITFTSKHDAATSKTYTVSVSGTNLMMNDGVSSDILTDKVSSFSLAYFDTYNGASSTSWASSRKIIGFTLGLTGAENVVTTFTSKVTPRNL